MIKDFPEERFLSTEEVIGKLETLACQTTTGDPKITEIMNRSIREQRVSGIGRSPEVILKEQIKRLARLSSSSSAQVKDFFIVNFLSSYASFFHSKSETAQIQWIKSSPANSPLIGFFKALRVLNSNNQVDSKIPVNELSEIIETSLDLLKRLLEKERIFIGDLVFNFDDLPELDQQLKKSAYNKMVKYVINMLKKQPSDQLALRLKELIEEESSVDLKITASTEALKENPDSCFFTIINQLFSNSSSIENCSKELFLEQSPLLTRLGVKCYADISILHQWRSKEAFHKEVEKAIYSQYKEKIHKLNLHFLLDFDSQLTSSNPKKSFEEILKQTRDCICNAEILFKEQKELRGILDGDFCETPLQARVDSLHENLFSSFIQKKEKADQSCYEKFAQFHFFFISIYETLLEKIPTSTLNCLYEEFAKLAYQDNNVPALYLTVHSLTYQNYQRALETVEESYLKELLVKKDEELTFQDLNTKEKMQKTLEFLLLPIFNPISKDLIQSLKWNFKQHNTPGVFLKGLTPVISCAPVEEEVVSRFVKKHLNKDKSEYKIYKDQLQEFTEFLQKEEGSPFYLFLQSRQFFTSLAEGECPSNSLQKLYKYQEIFKELTISKFTKLNGRTSFNSNSILDINNFAKQISLDYFLARLQRLTPKSQQKIVEEFWEIDENKDLSISEKMTQTQELLERQIVHEKSKFLKSILTGAFIAIDDEPIIQRAFHWKVPGNPNSIILKILRGIGIENVHQDSTDDSFFEKKKIIKLIKNFFCRRISGDIDLISEIDSVSDQDLEALEVSLQKVISKHMDSPVRLTDIMNLIVSDLEEVRKSPRI